VVKWHAFFNIGRKFFTPSKWTGLNTNKCSYIIKLSEIYLERWWYEWQISTNVCS
jgi:hypothetical protein